ncbi:hypothetical protein [Lentzea aerocolonigenes]|uniref:hypothetical protein n=1 Tax=Lentzea aerocolonigenes TaxID=68170 RepID=UPI0004C464F5|nr:hypothetical protein [Lentzea aerocolonigenes]MCP2245904.1 hypothetical protein [Lentzea aerocolonigenes]
MNESISRQLREAAEAHRPDRGRMLARVDRAMAGAEVSAAKPGIARSWTRVTFAGLAAAGALAVAGIAVAAIVRTGPPPDDTATIPTASSSVTTSSTTPAVGTTGSTVAPPAPNPPVQQTTGSTSSAIDPAPLSGKPVSDGPLSTLGFVDLHQHPNWAQSRVEFKTTQPLTAVSLELRVVQTGGVRTTGQWQTMPADDFTVTVKEADGAVIYRWELKPGRTMPVGVHTFAAQYNHDAGKRDARADGYVGQAGAFTVKGRFTSE